MTSRTTPTTPAAEPDLSGPFLPAKGRRQPPAAVRRPALYLAVAAAGALVVNALTAGEPAAQADSQLASVSVADQLGISGLSAGAPNGRDLAPLQQLAASRSQREAAQTAAAQAQADADKAEQERRAAEEAARKAADEEAARQAAAQEAQARAAQAAGPAAAGSFQDYALSKVGGDHGQFSCLENLWGKESRWNPTAQNPGSSAYGIAQFLDSTWAGTGIAKTSDGYRQIDAGLIYIDRAYGSPCAAWAHSRANNWY